MLTGDQYILAGNQRTLPGSRWKATSATVGAQGTSRSRSARLARRVGRQTLGPDDIIAGAAAGGPAASCASNTVDLLNHRRAAQRPRCAGAFSATPTRSSSSRTHRSRAPVRSGGVRRVAPLVGRHRLRAADLLYRRFATTRLRGSGRGRRPRLASPRRRAVARDAVLRHSCGDVVERFDRQGVVIRSGP